LWFTPHIWPGECPVFRSHLNNILQPSDCCGRNPGSDIEPSRVNLRRYGIAKSWRHHDYHCSSWFRIVEIHEIDVVQHATLKASFPDHASYQQLLYGSHLPRDGSSSSDSEPEDDCKGVFEITTVAEARTVWPLAGLFPGFLSFYLTSFHRIASQGTAKDSLLLVSDSAYSLRTTWSLASLRRLRGS
jgi:hypothetical protein